MTRLPRFNRSSEISPIRLTERDREILKHIRRHRFLRSDHFTALTGGSRQGVLRRLQRLYHHGYLERPRCQIDYYQRGSRRMVYGLGNKGAAWIKRELSLPYRRLDWPRKNDVVRYFMEHTLLVSDFMVALEIACRQQQNVRLLTEDDLNLPGTLELEHNPFRWCVNIQGGPVFFVIPDRVFGLQHTNGKRAWFALEADRATMPLSRRSLARSSLRRKILAYHATWTQGLYHQFGWRRFRVLTITIKSERARKIIELCKHLKNGQGLFLVTDHEHLHRQPDLLSLCWDTTRDSKTASLLD